MMRVWRFPLRRSLLAIVALFWVAACQPQASQSPATPPGTPASPAPVSLVGTGATFPLFLYQKWFAEFNRLNPTVFIDYQATGSGTGIQQMISETTDFGASDVAMTDADIDRVKRGVVLLPMTAGSIAIAYNLPGIQGGLKLPRQVYPEIFLGTITRWNDSKIAAANPDLNLPDLPITVVHRSDGSGTTAVFTAHLNAISPGWKEKVGSGLSVQWTTGTGVKSNAGVSAQIQQAEGAIGYVEYSYAKQLNMTTAALENQAGEYVQPTLESTTVALTSVAVPDNLRVFAPDPAGKGAYPIVTYSWLLAYQQYDDANKAKAIKDLVQWGATDGQKFSSDLGYVPLPPELAQKVLAAAGQIQP